jgi:hypothetical protein
MKAGMITGRLSSVLMVSVCAFFVFPASSNYELKGYKLGGGGSGVSESENNALLSVFGEGDSSYGQSSNYNYGVGDIYPIQANVPNAPTFVNPSSWYNKLSVTIDPSNNPSDALFAIAITDDNWSTTGYVQNDNTIGAVLGTEDYQTYAAWGGASGENIIGLTPSTEYKIKVKAMQGDFTESAYGPESTASTAATNISFSIIGISQGTSLEGVTTDITTTATEVAFDELPFETRQEAANGLVVSTNAVAGYQVSVRQEGPMVDGNSNEIASVSGSNTTPSTWPLTVTNGAYGYHSADEVLGTGNTSRFVNDDRFAQFDSVSYEVAYNAGPVTSEQTNIVYAIEVGYQQPAGDYGHTITYTAHGVF